MRLLFIVYLVVITAIGTNAQKLVVSGQVTDAKSGELLISANVFLKETSIGTVSNNYGFYSLHVPTGTQTIVCSFVGYQVKEFVMDITKNQTLNIALEPNIALDAVEITGKNIQRRVESTQMGMIELPMKKLEQLPTLLGEIDVIKTLQLLPGVSTGADGSAGFFVRGGGADQNLFLLDGVPLYNVNHMFGFFSVFNSDAVKSVSLIKGGFPARYGGRLSSVVGVRMKEGNMQEYHGNVSVGLLSSKLTLEGPIIENKTSFILTGRRTYLDLYDYIPGLSFREQQKVVKEYKTNYYFYDFNAKVNHVINDKNRLYLSGYFGKDIFYFAEAYNEDNMYKVSFDDTPYDFGADINWGNSIYVLRWNHKFLHNLFSNARLSYTSYKFVTGVESGRLINYVTDTLSKGFNFDFNSKIRDFAFSYDFDYSPNEQHFIRFGLNNTYHTFSPGSMSLAQFGNWKDELIDSIARHGDITANEFYLYAEDDFSVNDKLKINAGLHYSNFHVDNTCYHSLQPRIAARYLINRNISAKISYVNMTQYLNLLTNSKIGLPTDTWVPSTGKIKPQKSWQMATGISWNIKSQFEFTVEGYYKKMSNLIEFKEGTNIEEVNENWQKVVTQGKGYAYGIEFLLKRDIGKTTGWIGYTLAWSNRKFKEIGEGEIFPYKYDRRHDISIILAHKFNERIDIGTCWMFASGNAFTLGDERFNDHLYYKHQGVYMGSSMSEIIKPLYHFETRNNYRLPNNHRLDIGVNLHKQRRKFKRTLSLGVYNIYGHNNTLFVYETQEWAEINDTYKPVIKQISVFNFLPYIRFSINF